MAFRQLVMVIIAAALSGCAGSSRARTDVCLAALTALESGETGLIVDETATIGDEIDIRYRLTGEESPNRIRCGFETALAQPGLIDLISISFNGEELGPGRLVFLKRHWLTVEGFDAVKRRVVRRDT